MVVEWVREEKIQYDENLVDQDGLWKKVIGELFEDFLLFFAPELYAQVDFNVEPDFLDKELFQEVLDKKKGRRFADRLAKVRLKDGKEQWILVHIEVQSKKETDFPERMFQYFYRIYDRHQEKIVAIAVHTSSNQSDIPERFEYDYFGRQLCYSYKNYRTEAYTDEELERSDKLFSKIVLAAKALHQTKDEAHQRYLFKRKLMGELIRNQNYSRTAVQVVFHFIDYLLQLPEAYTKQLSEDIRPMIRKETELMELYNKENASPTILNAFDLELEKGIEQGIEFEKRDITKKLILKNMALETIAEITELTLEQVKEIQKTLN
ncbi:Rpn family recombination-promoting nuclease/putative transposase [Sporosarcina beigongshangi]|uniref:Rpn family recombination-promoting nuclease/putative transposase n=1 Tax=Sporosarcina beigongshangi TaxID=2782538 RepID=UPI001939BDD5|nr:Rpn family recombination-promoting nuclease/putative transposase [Sporosarcina beigongshangi]